jgi:hypothetical protein
VARAICSLSAVSGDKPIQPLGIRSAGLGLELLVPPRKVPVPLVQFDKTIEKSARRPCRAKEKRKQRGERRAS